MSKHGKTIKPITDVSAHKASLTSCFSTVFILFEFLLLIQFSKFSCQLRASYFLLSGSFNWKGSVSFYAPVDIKDRCLNIFWLLLTKVKVFVAFSLSIRFLLFPQKERKWLDGTLGDPCHPKISWAVLMTFNDLLLSIFSSQAETT